MKALFKLKEIPYNFKNKMSNEMAEEYYKLSKLPFSTVYGDGETRVSCGFYSVHLSFSEWIDYYRIKLL